MVRLFAPQSAAALYCHADGMLSNTARVDVEHPDLAAFPAYAAAPSWECVIGEGDMLYIPRGWFHYVASLSTSFSVSFWWARAPPATATGGVVLSEPEPERDRE